jgi:hypothetical protein
VNAIAAPQLLAPALKEANRGQDREPRSQWDKSDVLEVIPHRDQCRHYHQETPRRPPTDAIKEIHAYLQQGCWELTPK